MTADLTCRRLTPELLDLLPDDDPAAMGSGRDLRIVNRLMAQQLIMARLLASIPAEPPARPVARIVEIGSGDGTFMLAVLARMAKRWPGGEIILLDLKSQPDPRTIQRYGDLGWQARPVVADAFDWLPAQGEGAFDLAVANLVLHHFEDRPLADLLATIARASCAFAATEPRRSRMARRATALLRLVGANHVTLHDARVSVEAGFRGDELAEIWPAGDHWQTEEHLALPFTHAFAAWRKGFDRQLDR